MEISQLISANKKRIYNSFFSENPKSYQENLQTDGLLAFQNRLNKNYVFIDSNSTNYYGEEVSPFMLVGLGIQYEKLNTSDLIINSNVASKEWRTVTIEKRANILINSLKRVEKRFFELAYATMHTTGQSFLMSFQASGPHACDRALEVVASGVEQQTYYPEHVLWTKNFGKFDLNLNKTFKPIPKGISLVIGCSTFPTWNTIPGLYASLITGNSVIVKPHPKAVYPIAIFIDELKNELKANNIDTNIVQLAIDSISNPVTKELAEHNDVKLIDYTGGNFMGDYIEGLGKTCFTEKSGINSVIIESCNNADEVAQNIAFSVSLYSGQMCTAPQNMYIPEGGVESENGLISFDEMSQKIADAIKNLMDNPKANAGTLGAIQNDLTIKRIEEVKASLGSSILLNDIVVANSEFESARIKSPTLVIVNEQDETQYLRECFGPIVFIVKTKNADNSIRIAKKSAISHGAITCLAFATEKDRMDLIENEMNAVYTPVSFNFKGAAFVNQHAAFSDLHVSGGNPSGNASFTNAEFINKRYIWIGNRYML
ncbi:MAG: aldehyde dehydrogenase family protein [Bacteroidetes bacterium]|nr:aldehyde dehydrogenase family protein [Bacteroidota bacterium]